MAFIPGLLMVATFGLGRLESGLSDDTVTARDVADFLEHAEPVDMRTLARQGMPEALDGLHRRQSERAFDEPAHRSGSAGHLAGAALISPVAIAAEREGPPSRRHGHSWANRQFAAPRHAHRV